MSVIRILDSNTIDKIAAGEVVERPASVVKELVENSIDAGATIITVEIKNGGMKLIRVTDNGSGIEKDQIRNAFCAHATSKISGVDDLNHLYTLGFRGEALSSISAVSRVEVTSRTSDSLTGTHVRIDGGVEDTFEEVGAPIGTTFIIRDLFFNTLPRLKFLKTETAEGNNIADLMEHMALSMPGISFQFINNGNTKFSTPGRGDLREVIYRIYGKEIAENIRSIDLSNDSLSMKVSGYLGLPQINKSNRSGEIFYINHRYIKSPLISKAVEEGYKEYLMQHKFPFCVLNMEFDPAKVDVNVHPTKQEVRLSEEKLVYSALMKMVQETLLKREMIDTITLEGNNSNIDKTVSVTKQLAASRPSMPQLFEQKRLNDYRSAALNLINEEKKTVTVHSDLINNKKDLNSDVEILPIEDESDDFFIDDTKKNEVIKTVSVIETSTTDVVNEANEYITPEIAVKEICDDIKEYNQLNFLENEQILSKDARRQYKIIGQAFKTYWIIEYNDKLMLMDQHAAHEKVNFERMMKCMQNKEEIPSQSVSPPAIMTVSNSEMQIVKDNNSYFSELGFSLDEFGEHEIAIRSIPMDLYDNSPQEMISEIITDLLNHKSGDTPDSVRSRIATMACKASVKGNNNMNVKEVEELLDEMLTLDNPYNCPHGRPTIITITKNEMEKRFSRII